MTITTGPTPGFTPGGGNDPFGNPNPNWLQTQAPVDPSLYNPEANSPNPDWLQPGGFTNPPGAPAGTTYNPTTGTYENPNTNLTGVPTTVGVGSDGIETHTLPDGTTFQVNPYEMDMSWLNDFMSSISSMFGGSSDSSYSSNPYGANEAEMLQINATPGYDPYTHNQGRITGFDEAWYNQLKANGQNDLAAKHAAQFGMHTVDDLPYLENPAQHIINRDMFDWWWKDSPQGMGKAPTDDDWEQFRAENNLYTQDEMFFNGLDQWITDFSDLFGDMNSGVEMLTPDSRMAQEQQLNSIYASNNFTANPALYNTTNFGGTFGAQPAQYGSPSNVYNNYTPFY